MNDPIQQQPQAGFDDDEISLLDLGVTIVENLRLLILAPIFAGCTALLVGTYAIDPFFTAKTSLLPPGASGGGTAAALASQFGGLASLAGINLPVGAGQAKPMAYLQSDSMRNALIDRFDLVKRYEAKLKEDARKTLATKVKIAEDKKTGLISIEVTDLDPAFAAQLANAHVEELQKVLNAQALEDARERRQFLERQIEEASKKPYQSPLVRDAVLQGLIRQFETTRIEEAGAGNSARIQQVDVAQAPERKSGPKRALIAVITALATGFALLLFVFMRKAVQNAGDDPESSDKLKAIQKGLRKAFFLR
jgi:capsular polysaccharide biosynthesis protein